MIGTDRIRGADIPLCQPSNTPDLRAQYAAPFHDGARAIASRRRRLHVRALLFAAFLVTLIAGCAPKPEAKFYVARPVTEAAERWEVYYDSTWHEVKIDGVRPPMYVRRFILTAGNWFTFAGAIDTVSRGTPDKPVFRLEAWNIVQPIRRDLTPGIPPDTTGFPLLIRDDFSSDLDFSKFSLSVSSQPWPRLNKLEHPPRPPVAPVDTSANGG
jgi:hypothetical protein